MTNLTKDKLKIVGVLLVVLWFLSGLVYYLFADNNPKEKELTEIRDYIANMTDEEYYNTFLKEE